MIKAIVLALSITSPAMAYEAPKNNFGPQQGDIQATMGTTSDAVLTLGAKYSAWKHIDIIADVEMAKDSNKLFAGFDINHDSSLTIPGMLPLGITIGVTTGILVGSKSGRVTPNINVFVSKGVSIGLGVRFDNNLAERSTALTFGITL